MRNESRKSEVKSAELTGRAVARLVGGMRAADLIDTKKPEREGGKAAAEESERAGEGDLRGFAGSLLKKYCDINAV